LFGGTSFPYLEYLPRPGHAHGVQIEMDPKRVGLRFPLEVGLVGDSGRVLHELLPQLKPQLAPPADPVYDPRGDESVIRRRVALLGLMVAVVTAATCGGAGAGQSAKLRVFDGITSGGVSILVDGATVSSNLQYQTNTGYLSVKSGSRQLEALPAGVSGPWGVARDTISLSANTQNTWIVFGWLMDLGSVPLIDDVTPAGNSAAKLRIADAALSESGVDVYVLPSGTTPSGSAMFSFMSGEGASPYMSLAAGAYDVDFAVSPACPVVSSPCPIDIFYQTTVTVAANQNRTVVLLDNCPPDGLICDHSTYTSLTLADLN
jgi:Domain of unknown function (DUF4397)